MSRPAISVKKLSGTLDLAECHDGWWLYDHTRGMNLSMRAKTPEDAFVEALTYYQRRLSEVETELRGLKRKVDDFVSNFIEEDRDE